MKINPIGVSRGGFSSMGSFYNSLTNFIKMGIAGDYPGQSTS